MQVMLAGRPARLLEFQPLPPDLQPDGELVGSAFSNHQPHAEPRSVGSSDAADAADCSHAPIPRMVHLHADSLPHQVGLLT